MADSPRNFRTSQSLRPNPEPWFAFILGPRPQIWGCMFDVRLWTGPLDPANWTGRAVNRRWHATTCKANPFGVTGEWTSDVAEFGPNVINYAASPPDVVAQGLRAPALPFTDYPLTQS